MKRSQLKLWSTGNGDWELQYLFNDRVQSVIPLPSYTEAVKTAADLVRVFNAAQPEE